MNLNKTTQKQLNDLMEYLPDGHLTGIHHCGDDSWCASLVGVEEGAVEGYLAAIEQGGYRKYGESTVENNRFYTHIGADGQVLTSTYLPHNRTLCAVIDGAERGTALYDWQSEGDKASKKDHETVLTQIGLCYDLAEGISPFDLEGKPGPDFTGGQFNILRLEDGSMIVIDGGHWRESNATLVYDMLRKNAPDPEHIVIAAWIFTHAHADHVCAFIEFGPRYGDKVTVERFLYNLPAVGTPQIKPTVDTMKEYFPRAQRLITHTGQTYRVRNAKIQILVSFDLIQPIDLSWFNETSIAFSIEAEGKRMMFLTDIGPKENNLMYGMYSAETLKSDFIQVAHHGWNGGSYKLNERIAADYVLFNGTTAPLDASWNKYFFEKVTRSSGVVEFRKKDYIKEIYRAIEGVDEFILREGEEPEARVYQTH